MKVEEEGNAKLLKSEKQCSSGVLKGVLKGRGVLRNIELTLTHQNLPASIRLVAKVTTRTFSSAGLSKIQQRLDPGLD